MPLSVCTRNAPRSVVPRAEPAVPSLSTTARSRSASRASKRALKAAKAIPFEDLDRMQQRHSHAQ